MGRKKGVKLIISIVERGHGKDFARLLDAQGITFHYQCPAIGTASSDLLEILGIGSPDRDVLFSYAANETADRLLYQLKNDELDMRVNTKGIVFDMPLTGLNQIVAAVLFEKEGETFLNGGDRMEQAGKNSLILVTVNQGHTDAVMDTARKAGARGGTVLRARWAGSEESETIYGITCQEEKEIIAIVTAGEKRNLIMESIQKKHGLATEAGAMLCSLGIDEITKLG